MSKIKAIFIMLAMVLSMTVPAVCNADEQVHLEVPESEIDVAEILFGHTSDGYGWHLTSWKGRHLTIPLPSAMLHGVYPINPHLLV